MSSGRAGLKITVHVHLEETISLGQYCIICNQSSNLKFVHIVCFCLIYLSVFGAETIKSDERPNIYFGHILVT